MTYGLPFYDIVWILVRQRPLMGQEFQNDFSGLFGNTFRSGLASCESRFIIFCFISLFIYLYFFIFYFFLASIRSKFLLRGASIYILVFANLLWFLGSPGGGGEFIFGTVACWWHAILPTIKSSAPFQDCFLWESVFPVKTMVSLWFLLELNFTMDIIYFSSSFHHAFMLR